MENGAKTNSNKFENFKGFFKQKSTDKSSVTETLKEKVKKGNPKTEAAPVPAAGWRGFFKTAAREETAGKALLGLFLYSLLMFFLPLGVFFGSKQLLEENEYEAPVSTIGPAILAIVTVNIVIVLYVIKAFREENKAKEAAAVAKNK